MRLPVRSRWAGLLLIIVGPVVIAAVLIASHARFGNAIDDDRMSWPPVERPRPELFVMAFERADGSDSQA